MPAGAVAGQGDARSIHAKLFCVPVDNHGTSFCIIVRRRKRVLRGQTILYSDHPAPTEPGKLAQLIVMGGKAAADKTAAVVVDKRG